MTGCLSACMTQTKQKPALPSVNQKTCIYQKFLKTTVYFPSQKGTVSAHIISGYKTCHDNQASVAESFTIRELQSTAAARCTQVLISPKCLTVTPVVQAHTALQNFHLRML